MTKLGDVRDCSKRKCLRMINTQDYYYYTGENPRNRETGRNEEITNNTRSMLWYRVLRRKKWTQLYYYFPIIISRVIVEVKKLYMKWCAKVNGGMGHHNCNPIRVPITILMPTVVFVAIQTERNETEWMHGLFSRQLAT